MNVRLRGNGLSRVRLTFTCTACKRQASVEVPWGMHHCLPPKWRARDAVPTYALARRTDHIFACSARCQRSLNERFPPPKRPRWFKYA